MYLLFQTHSCLYWFLTFCCVVALPNRQLSVLVLYLLLCICSSKHTAVCIGSLPSVVYLLFQTHSCLYWFLTFCCVFALPNTQLSVLVPYLLLCICSSKHTAVCIGSYLLLCICSSKQIAVCIGSLPSVVYLLFQTDSCLYWFLPSVVYLLFQTDSCLYWFLTFCCVVAPPNRQLSVLVPYLLLCSCSSKHTAVCIGSLPSVV